MKKTETTFDVKVTTHHGEVFEAKDENNGDGKAAIASIRANDITRITGDGDITYIPFHALVHDEITKTVTEKEYEDDMCGGGGDTPEPEGPTISGADDITISEGDAFDPMTGVSATDSEGNPVDVTVSGEVDTETPGEYTLTYTATADGKTTTITRKVTVAEKSTPIINGANDVTINQGIGIDLKDGVTATLDGEEIEFTVDPETIEKCDVGEHDVTYTATGNGKTTTAIRKVTIEQIENPTISGLTELTVEVGEEFDPLEGVAAKDANGNDIDVEIVEQDEPDEPQGTILIDVTDYSVTANKSESMAKPNPWSQDMGMLDIETENVVIVKNGTEQQISIGNCYVENGSIIVWPTETDYDEILFVKFSTDQDDDTKFYSVLDANDDIGSLPEIKFGKLVIREFAE